MSFVIILILAFENVQATCTYLTFFLTELSSSVAPTFVLFGAAFMGMICGGFTTMFLVSLFNKNEDDDDDIDFEA